MSGKKQLIYQNNYVLMQVPKLHCKIKIYHPFVHTKLSFGSSKSIQYSSLKKKVNVLIRK